MKVDNSNHNRTSSAAGGKKLVAANDSGEGLPYAPVDWPEPGDTWRWKVGSRTSLAGHFIDRYLYLPKRLQPLYGKTRRFASKRSVKEFVAVSFPNKDVDELFASFCWKIPSGKERLISTKIKGVQQLSFESFESDEKESDYYEDAQSGVHPKRCKAGNKRCNSLIVANSSGELEANQVCGMCCKSDSFCKYCCCTICLISSNISANGGLDHVRCEAPTGANFVCGHIVHLNCALQTFMAGTIGGCIDLDTECLCRTCNSKTDLIPHVEKILKASQSNSSMDDVQKSLRMCANLLYGSTKTKAINLMGFVKLTMGKIKNGMPLEDIWKVEEEISPAINVAAGTIDHNDVVVADERKRKNLGEEEYEVRRNDPMDLIDSNSKKKRSGDDQANEEGDHIGGKAKITMGGGDEDIL